MTTRALALVRSRFAPPRAGAGARAEDHPVGAGEWLIAGLVALGLLLALLA